MRRGVIVSAILLLGLVLPSAVSAKGGGRTTLRGPIGHKVGLVSSSGSATTYWIALLQTQAENPNASPDWNLTGNGLKTALAGTTVIFSQYFQIYNGPTKTTVSYTDYVYLNGQVFAHNSSTYNMTNDPKSEWRHYYGPLTLKKLGTYVYWCTITINGISVSGRGTITVT